jgi:hypothetical protein
MDNEQFFSLVVLSSLYLICWMVAFMVLDAKFFMWRRGWEQFMDKFETEVDKFLKTLEDTKAPKEPGEGAGDKSDIETNKMLDAILIDIATLANGQAW